MHNRKAFCHHVLQQYELICVLFWANWKVFLFLWIVLFSHITFVLNFMSQYFRIVTQEGLEGPAQRQCMPKWWRRCAMKPSLIRKGTKEWHPETTLLACLSRLLIEWQKSWSWILIPEKRFVCIPFHFYQFWVIHTS